MAFPMVGWKAQPSRFLPLPARPAPGPGAGIRPPERRIAAINAPGDWVRETKDARIPMRDEKWLAADVYLPPKKGKYPAILIQTPYDKSRLGAPISRRSAGRRRFGRRGRRTVGGLYDRENYAYVVVDWRGFYGSKIAGRGVPRPERGKDGFDTCAWIIKQPWSNGKIGTWGPSALGKQQYSTAVKKPPALVCSAVLIAAMGQDYRFYYRGGVYREAHCATLDLLGYGVSGKVRAAPLPTQFIWRFARRQSYQPEKIQVPMLLVTGWWDHFPDAILETFRDLRRKGGPRTRKHTRLVIGPWDHMNVDVVEQGDLKFPGGKDVEKEASMAFFDYFLRSRKNGYDKRPVVRYIHAGETGDGAWTGVSKFPGVKIKRETRFLTASGEIRRKPPGKKDAAREFDGNPAKPVKTLGGANLPPLPSGPTDHRGLAERADVLGWRSEKLDSPMRVTGNMRVLFTAVVNRVDADFCVWVCDEFPDGGAYLVGDSVQRAKLREGTVKLLEPGKPVDIDVTLPLTAYTFLPGHRVRVFLATSNSPRYERNPHTGDNHWDAAKALPVHVRVFQDREHPATLTLPLAPARKGAGRPKRGKSETTKGQ